MNSFPFTSQDGDRKVMTSDFRELFKKYFTNGVFNGTFNVVQSTGMKVVLKKGWCNIEGCFGWVDEDIELTIESVSQETTHNIVLRLDDNREVRTINAYVVKGNPSAVAPTRTETVYELVVARIKTNVTTTSIQQSMIEDTRLDTNLCGIVSTTVKEIDTTTFYEQIQADLQEFKDNEQAEFLEWFETIKDQLSTDVAGNLQNQIDDINAKKTSLIDANNNPIVTAPMIAPINKLVNGDFQINQRGQSEYSTTNIGGMYTLDMWRIIGANTTTKLTVLDRGVKLENQGTGASVLTQRINIEDVSNYTVVLKVNNIVGNAICEIYDMTGAYEQHILSNGINVINIKNKSLRDVSPTINGQGSLEVKYIDIFDGDTAYHHVREDYGTALMRCLPYIETIFGVFNSYYSAPTNAAFNYNFRVKKKYTPIVTIDNYQLSDSLGGNLSNVVSKGVEEALVDRVRWAYTFDTKNSPFFYNYAILVISCEPL